MQIANYPTKKAFKEAVANDPNSVWISDPACVDPCSGYLEDVLAIKGQVEVTNHPRRSWYASVTYNADGKLIVE